MRALRDTGKVARRTIIWSRTMRRSLMAAGEILSSIDEIVKQFSVLIYGGHFTAAENLTWSFS